MARDEIRRLKKAVRQGSTEAAVVLLERSIAHGHKKLAILRSVVAERLGAALRRDQVLYCRSAIQELSDEDIASILHRAAQVVPRKT
jgi:hypothetical protein